MATVSVNGLDFNVLASVDDALIYITGSTSESATTWLASDEDFQGRTLVSANRIMNRLRWIGEVAVPNQPNAWPRIGEGITPTPPLDSPIAIYNGFYELALLLVENPELANSPSSGSNVQRAKGGDAEVWFFRSTLDGAPPLPTAAYAWFKPYLLSGVGILSQDSGTFQGEFTSVFDNDPEGEVY
jgi:hypothetical protein